MVRNLIVLVLLMHILIAPAYAYAASARCEVVKKEGNVLIMDCGEQARGFSEKSKVKIKTDRGNRQDSEQ